MHFTKPFRDCRPSGIAFRLLTITGCLILASLVLPSTHAYSQAVEKPGPDNLYQAINEILDERMSQMDWGDGRIGILVEDAKYPLQAYAHADTTLMQPGSLMKILTTAAALERLGEDYRFSTRLYLSGTIDRHVLKGALVVQGSGDPSFPVYDPNEPNNGYAVFDQWAKMLKKMDIRKIDGPVIGDDRAFDSRTFGAGWPSERRGDPKVPMVSALNFNGNCVSIYWETGRWLRKIATYTMFPKLDDTIYFSNNLRVMETVRNPRELSRVKDGNLITASGEIAPGIEAMDRVSIEGPTTFYAKILKKRLETGGIKVEGEAMAIADYDDEINTTEMQLVDEQFSPPVKILLRDMLRNDSTLDAESLFKAMGQQIAKDGIGSFESGGRAVNAYFDDLRLPGANRVIVDGSGLSSIDRLSPSHLVNLMRRIEGRPSTREIASYMPKAWEIGPLENRFRPSKELTIKHISDDEKEGDALAIKEGTEKDDTSLKAPQVQAITASDDGLEGMAGWVTNRVGHRLVFAIMVSDSKTPAFQLRKQIDLLVLELANSGL